MSRRAYVYFVLTFILGLVVGVGCSIFYGWHAGMFHPRHPDEKRIVHFLQHRLNLDDTQTQQVDQIVRDSSEKFRQLQQQVDPQFDAIRQESQDRIRKVLNPEQLAKFNELVRHMEERRKEHRMH
jgi:Spy/CpxP family protein refolding chaperone